MTKAKNSTTTTYQGIRMDTPTAKQHIVNIMRALRIRGIATIEDLALATRMSVRTISRFLGFLREAGRVERVSKSRVAVGEKVLYMPVQMNQTREQDKSNLIKRRMLGSNEWKRGEHCGLAAFWPPAPAAT